MKLDIIRANPAGNITLFVKTPVERADYAAVGKALLDIKDLDAEQVAFICGPDKMEMCGLEFCGNASRSFALYLAKEHGSKTHMMNVSGMDAPLKGEADPETGYAAVHLPSPVSIRKYSASAFDIAIDAYIYLVTMKGITHAVVFDIPPSDDLFEIVRGKIEAATRAGAIGVMLYDSATNFMTPIVYVKDVNSTHYEGSCGSGTVAMASVLALNEKDDNGTFAYSIKQPQGTIVSKVSKADGKITDATIEGYVTISDVMSIEIEKGK